MAKKKTQEQPAQAPQQQTPQISPREAAAQTVIRQLQEQQQYQRQIDNEAKNKEHDVEFSPYSQGTGNNANLGVIGETQVKDAYQTLMNYRQEKANLEQKIEENERFWKLRHWEEMTPGGDDGRIKPKSAWLVNTIMNKHADAMDNYPEANILPRARDDEAAAKALSSIIPVILEQNDFQHIYSDEQWYKLKNGTGVYGIFWNNDKNGGLGDIDIKKIDLEAVYWKGGLTDIQESPNFFYVTMMNNDEIKARYPEINVGSSGMLPLSPLDHYHDDENIDTTNETPVIDWYYRKRVQYIDKNGLPQTKTLLHYCQFCNEQVIYASENDPERAEIGWYAHGMYPFVFDVLYPVEGSACGMGYIDIIKDDQCFIDKLQQAILENAITNARPRYAVRSDGGLNEKEFADLSKPIVHFEGNLGEDAFRQIVPSPLSSIYETVYQYKIQEMKDTSGNTASSQGQASSVTSASGIASLQEAAGKLSRDTNLESYRAYKQVVNMVIELIREFYNEPRCFRIIGENGGNDYMYFDNAGLVPQNQKSAFGIDLGSRLPILDVEVKPQKRSAYSKESQNQTALNFYNLGFFAPNNADASLACLEMMDFDQIDKVKDRIKQNGTLYDQVMQLQQMMMQLTTVVDAQNGTNMTEQIASGAQATMQNGNVEKKGSVSQGSKGSLSSQAASATRGSTSPR